MQISRKKSEHTLKSEAGMEKREVEGTCIYVTKMPVTPSTIGIFRPKIIMPEVILKFFISCKGSIHIEIFTFCLQYPHAF